VKKDGGVAKVPAGVKRKGADGKDRHGDAAIALALGYAASREDVLAYGYETPARVVGGATDAGSRFEPDHRDTGIWHGGAF